MIKQKICVITLLLFAILFIICQIFSFCVSESESRRYFAGTSAAIFAMSWGLFEIKNAYKPPRHGINTFKSGCLKIGKPKIYRNTMIVLFLLFLLASIFGFVMAVIEL